jgi:hypothetical protein
MQGIEVNTKHYERTGEIMRRTSYREKDAVISGICFLLHAIFLFLAAFLALILHFFLADSFFGDIPNDSSIRGWYFLFGLFAMLFLGAIDVIVLGVIQFAIIYLVMGILVLRKKCGLGLAVVTFLLAAVHLFCWIQQTTASDVTLSAINPVSIAGTGFFASYALILGLPKLSSGRWFVRKYWWVPCLLLMVSFFVAPLQNAWFSVTGSAVSSSGNSFFLIGIIRGIFLLLTYFYGCRWMKKEAEDDF